MAIFNWFGAKPKMNEETILGGTGIVASQETKSENSTSEENAKENDGKQFITITWGTGLPIDIIFNFIHKNFEDEGFQDALVNGDITYRDAKEKIIRNDLEMLFKRIILRYKADMRKIDVDIDNARNACALAAANRLQAQRETFKEHLAEINEMQQLLYANDPKMTTMIDSYRRGFLKGIAAKSISNIGEG